MSVVGILVTRRCQATVVGIVAQVRGSEAKVAGTKLDLVTPEVVETGYFEHVFYL